MPLFVAGLVTLASAAGAVHLLARGVVQVPCTVVVGTLDRTSPPVHADALVEGIRGARLHRIEGVGHAPNFEAPDAVAELIRAASAKAAPGHPSVPS
ncbi:hypothetical protein TBR22_A28660 [Luteitalea sp. TBR-22]|uniref:alpha/beta fold hydrolase n=1 Tax=Luteitalea sp. TBR-22 TaxID=2802971 RepID=UPI001AF97CA6|nr:hypothetical protein TBR22_A28660 [Luteitalea sp. TBR-22]